VEERVLSRDALCAALRDDVGISAALVDRWVACGALDATYEPLTGPPPPPIASVPPSRR
jgi:hypothetical protein